MASQQDVLSGGVNSAQQALRLKKELKLLETQTLASYQQGRKAQAEATFQEWMVKMFGTGIPGQPGFKPGPLWNLHLANASSAQQLARSRKLDNMLLENMANVAGTKFGDQLAFLRYLMSAWKGR